MTLAPWFPYAVGVALVVAAYCSARREAQRRRRELALRNRGRQHGA